MPFPQPQIIGRSMAIQKILEMTEKVSSVDLNVLITGESGVGKELVARSLHYFSPRSEAPFIKVNSAALPAPLIESELFGYEKGAFTGADKRQNGKFEQARAGTIFLDEIGELPLTLQAKLLQVLHDRRYFRIGGNREVAVHARVITATNQNLELEVNHGHFRDDLYYRLSTISIHIPPLRERKEDIPLLIEHFLDKIRSTNHTKPVALPQSLVDLFYEYHWPGNVREMENYLSRLCVLHNYKELEEELLRNLQKTKWVNSGVPRPLGPPPEPQCSRCEYEKYPSLREIRDNAVKQIEREVIYEVLSHTNWNRKQAAKILKISYRSLLYKIKEMDLHPPTAL